MKLLSLFCVFQFFLYNLTDWKPKGNLSYQRVKKYVLKRLQIQSSRPIKSILYRNNKLNPGLWIKTRVFYPSNLPLLSGVIFFISPVPFSIVLLFQFEQSPYVIFLRKGVKIQQNLDFIYECSVRKSTWLGNLLSTYFLWIISRLVVVN